MSGNRIGEVARAAGVAPSAIRYYEKAGLLPKPARRSNQRRYGPETVGRVRIILLARQAGFTIAEAREFLTAGWSNATPAKRWRTFAAIKLQELDARMTRIARMKELLETSFRCGCLRIDDCERAMAGGDGPRCVKSPSRSRRASAR